MKARLIFVIFIALSLVGNAVPGGLAQEGQPPPNEPEAETEQVSGPASSEVGVEPEAEAVVKKGSNPVDEIKGPAETKKAEAPAGEAEKPGNVTLVFKDADIRTVLHTLSYKSGVNIVAAEGVEGKVNIRLIDVPWQTALEVILKNHGLAYERLGNIIRVITLASVAEEELQNEVFVLNYSNAKGVAEAIKDTLTERGSIAYDERTNTLIINDIPTNLGKVREVIKRLDRKTPQVAIDVRIVETTLAENENLGIDWQIKVIAKGSKIPTTLPFERKFAHMDWLRSRMPYPEPVKRTITYDEETHTQIVDQEVSDFPTSGTISSGVIDPGAPSFPFTDTEPFLFGTLDFSQFQAVLEILKQRADTNIVSNPRISALDNQKALIHIGQTLNLPTFERNPETGNMEITGYKEDNELKLGVTLEVTPTVNEANYISLIVKPRLASLLRYDNLTAEIKAPVIAQRTAETKVMVKSGQTVAIGGLVTERDVDKVNKVPILGDIPIIGLAFKKTEKQKEKVDLIFFITVHILDQELLSIKGDGSQGDRSEHKIC